VVAGYGARSGVLADVVEIAEFEVIIAKMHRHERTPLSLARFDMREAFMKRVMRSHALV